MITGNEPAMPTGQSQSGTGLTIRQQFAVMCLQGLISNCFHNTGIPDETHVEKAIVLADLLINELNKQQ